MSLVPWILTLALQGAPAADTPALAVALRPVGLDAATTKAVKARLESELSAAEVPSRMLSLSPAAACFESEPCVQGLLKGGPALLDVEVVRVGPLVQLSLRLFGADGSLLDGAGNTAEADAFPGEGAIIDGELLRQVQAQVPKAPPPTAPAIASSPQATETKVIEVAQPEQPKGPQSLPLLGYGGIGVAAAGGLLVVGSGLVALSEANVLEDATSLRLDKDRALVLGPVALGVMGAGVLVLGAGGAMTSVGFAME